MREFYGTVKNFIYLSQCGAMFSIHMPLFFGTGTEPSVLAYWILCACVCVSLLGRLVRMVSQL